MLKISFFIGIIVSFVCALLGIFNIFPSFEYIWGLAFGGWCMAAISLLINVIIGGDKI